MAKKKPTPPPAPAPEPEPDPVPPEDRRIGVIHIKGSVAYARWLDALHRRTRIPKAVLFRMAMEEWCKAHGHEAPPEF